MKNPLKKYLFVFLLALNFDAFSTVLPPSIEGSSLVNSGVAYTYTFTESWVALPTWNIISGSATINSTWSSGTTYYASITWTASGTVAFYDDISGAYAEKAISVRGSSISAPTPIHASRCGAGTVALSAALGSGGDKVLWYTSLTGGTHVAEGLTYTTPSISTTTTYYIVTWNSSTSQGSIPRTPITATVNAAVNQPTSSTGGTSCGPAAITISAVPGSGGNNIVWYASPVGDNIAYTGTSFTTPVLTTSTTYYAASINSTTGCTSTRIPVLAQINEKPSQTGAQQLNNIYGSGTTGLKAYLYFGSYDGAPTSVYPEDNTIIDEVKFEVKWYATEANALAGTSSLYTGVTFTTPTLSATKTYYVRIRDKVTNCLGDVSEVKAVVIPLITSAKIQSDLIRVTGKKNEAALGGLNNTQKSTTIVYLDGIGRTAQQIVMAGSQLGKDIVMPVAYDNLGRSSKNYLPYVDNSSSNGAFKSSYVIDQLNFYQASGDKIANDVSPFAIAKFEDTPEGRLIEQGGVGSVWQPGTGHTTSIKYSFNTGSTNSEAEEVRKFNSDASSTGFYAANKLHRLESTDAMGNKEIVFQNSLGQTIAKKTQLDKTTEGVMVNYIQTYYCYNEVGQVTYIIQPKGIKALKSASWNITQAIRDQHMFQYTYDGRGRVISKKVPGSDWEYIVYDQMNRPVLTQDANTRALNKWNFIKYDNKGRVVMTGLYTDAVNTTRSSLQAILDLKNYDGSDKYFEIRKGSTTHGYSNQAFPISNIQITTVNYYDGHDFNFDGTQDYAYAPQSLPNEGTTASSSFGRSTGSKILIDDGTGSKWKISYVFHDSYGRVIQTKSNNHLNTNSFGNLNTTVYDFEKVTRSKVVHDDGPTTVTIINRPVYDNITGSLTKIYQSLNGGAELLVAQYQYNDLGQLVDKKLHGTGTQGSETFLQSVDYRYAINGQLLSINNAQLTAGENNDETNDYFGMELMYNDVSDASLGNTARFDGSVSAIKWKAAGATSGAEDQRSYKFSYDKSNKLETATSQVRGATTWNKEANAQNESMTYDLNGNVKTLLRYQRKHQLAGVVASYTSDQIDNLTYTYNSTNANLLDKVTDASQTIGFNNGSSGTSTDYTYYSNGSIKSDLNKGISLITYNHLGKTTRIDFTDGRKIEYLYDAVGNKLTMKSFQGTTLLMTTDYVNGFVYENNALSFFGSPEGRVVKKGSVFEYQYAIADHQGNTRVVFSSVAPTADAPVATFEGDGNDGAGQFINGGLNIVTFVGANHTNLGNKVVRMNQSNKIGPAKSVKVYPGDKIDIEVWEYHEGTSGFGTTGTPINTLITAVATAFTGAVIPTEVGSMSAGVNSALTLFGTGGNQGNSQPAAYLNYILFDKNYKLLDAGWQLAPANTFTKQKMSFPTKNIKEEGFLFTWLSYDNNSNNYVYFDDFKVTHTKSNVIQYNEYYPFGLQTSNSWTRTDYKNDYLYNAGNELNQTSGWYEMFYRGYDPTTARMLQVDPYAAVYASHSTYNYSMNNPVMMNDPSGGQSAVPDGTSVSAYNRLMRLTGRDDSMQDYSSWYEDDFGGNGGGGGTFSGFWSNFLSSVRHILDFGGVDGRTVVGKDGRLYGANETGQTGYGYWKDDDTLLPLDGGILGKRSVFVLNDKQSLGGRLFSDLSKGLEHIYNNSFRDGKVWRENSGWIVEGGFIALSTEGYSKSAGKVVTNGPRVSHNDYLKITRDGYVVFGGNRYKILGHIHSHPNSHDSGPTIPNDFYMLTNLNIPIFTIGTGGVHQGIIGDDGNMYNVFLGNRQLFFNGTFSITDYLD